MPAAADELRRELRELLDRRGRGDVREKDFERRLAEASVALIRAMVGERLAADEGIVAEHHLVHSHFRLTQSLLQEPEQATVSFFATDRRLIRVRGTLLPGRPVTCDDADATVVDELGYAGILHIARRKQRRWGEVAAGLGAALLAFLLGDALAITGPLLACLGLAGALHGLLFPTRWIEILPRDAPPVPPFQLHGVRRGSARRVLAVVAGAIGPRQEHPSASDQAGHA
jgi:hypothetical protein